MVIIIMVHTYYYIIYAVIYVLLRIEYSYAVEHMYNVYVWDSWMDGKRICHTLWHMFRYFLLAQNNISTASYIVMICVYTEYYRYYFMNDSCIILLYTLYIKYFYRTRSIHPVFFSFIFVLYWCTIKSMKWQFLHEFRIKMNSNIFIYASVFFSN